MDPKPHLSSSTVIFLAKLKNFLDSIGLSLAQFLQNLGTINNNQISRLEFFRIMSLIHIQTYNNFDPQQAFLQLSLNNETIQGSDLKKVFSMIGTMMNEKKQGQQKARQEEMKKKVIKIGLHKLQYFINHHPSPILYFHQFDLDGNNALNKVQMGKMLLATDINEFASKEIRKMLLDFIFKYFPKGEITINELGKFFKLPTQTHSNSPQSADFNKHQSPPLVPQNSPPHKHQQHNPSPQNNHHHLQIPKSPSLPQKSQQHNDPFHKKKQPGLLKPTYPTNNEVKKPQNHNYIENKISNCDSLYPLSMKYYRQGEPQPFQYHVFQELETFLKKKGKFSDKDNPRIEEGRYQPASSIFTSQFYIFQMASSVLMRQKSRIGIAQQIEPKDIIQGSVGDCYFLSSIASIISIYPELISDRFLFNVNTANFYAVKLFIDGEWKIITTDDQFPCRQGHPLYAKPHHNQIWVMLLQKCWAKVFGSYQSIASGSSKEGFLALTGAPCEVISQQKENEEAGAGAMKQLEIAQKKGYVATMSGSNYLQSLGKKAEEQYGLVSGHAYSLIKIINVKGEHLVKLRNPWGSTIWKGQWSFGSERWTKELRNKYNYNKSPQDGSFYMNWRDFRKFFGEIIVCKLNPIFMHDSIRAKTNRHKSGYFLMQVKTPGQYIVSIYQENKRKMSVKYTNYDYSAARLIILKREGNNMRYIGSRSTSQYQACSVDVDLEEGEYILSAKTEWKFWEDHQLVVTSYGTDHTTITSINRAIAPAFKESMIRTYATMFAGTGKVKSYQKYGFNATCQTNFSLETGIGYIRMINKSDKGFQSTQELESKGLKLIKPNKYPLSFVMGPKSEKIYGFFVSAAGFQYSNSEKIKY